MKKKKHYKIWNKIKLGSKLLNGELKQSGNIIQSWGKMLSLAVDSL